MISIFLLLFSISVAAILCFVLHVFGIMDGLDGPEMGEMRMIEEIVWAVLQRSALFTQHLQRDSS